MSRFKRISVLFLGLWLMGSMTAVVWARNPVPIVPVPNCNPGNPGTPVPANCTRQVQYYPEVFVPAIQSQDVNLQSTVYEIFLSLLSSMFEASFKCDAQCKTAIGAASIDGGKSLAEHRPTGLIPGLGQAMVGFVSQPPVSSVDYIAHVGQKLHLVSPAYAQGAGQIGFGYEGLAPARKLWTGFRNIAYLIATIGFVVLSFMIMFRLKISAQTVIGAQQAITKLIVVFLAITFSYAIAGLVIDLIFIFSFVIITLFVSTGLVTSGAGGNEALNLQGQLFSGSIFHQFAPFVTVSQQAGGVLSEIVQDLTTSVIGGFGGLGTSIANFIGGGFGLIGTIIIGVAILYAMFKALFQLLMTFLEILMLTVLAPILLLPDILPGGGAFMGWLRRLFANAMVFPTVTFMLLLGRAIVGAKFDPATGGFLPNPTSPFEGGLYLPFLGIGADQLTPFLGLGVILMIPKSVDMVKNALKVSAFQYTSAIGQALAFGAARTAPIYNPMLGAQTLAQGAMNVPFLGKYVQAGIGHAQRQVKLSDTQLQRQGISGLRSGTVPLPSWGTRMAAKLGGKK